jgi:flagellar basal body-associated protein FliL
MKNKNRLVVLAIIILLATVILTFVILCYWAFHSDLKSFPNRLWQYLFWKVPLIEKAFLINPVARKSFGFVFAGDDKYDFLTNIFYKKILIEIDYESNLKLPSELERDIKNIILSLVPEKEVKVVVSGNGIELKEDKGFNPRQYQDFYSEGGSKVIHLIFLPAGSMAYPLWYGGLAYSSDSIIVFLRKNSPSKIDRYLIRSRFAHEFGHLIDLKHIDDQNCVMYSKTMDVVNEMTESFFLFIESRLEDFKSEKEREAFAETFFHSQYCPQELKIIKGLKYPPLVRFGVYPGSYYYKDEPAE